MFAMSSGDRLEAPVLRQVNAATNGDLVTMSCSTEEMLSSPCNTPPMIDGVTLEQAGKGKAVSVSGTIQRGHATAIIRNATIGGGLDIAQDTDPLIENVRFTATGSVAVTSAGTPTIRRSRFDGGPGTGISLSNGKGLVIGNSFLGFSKAQAISINGTAAPRIADNRFETLSSTANAIWTYGEAQAIIENNDFAHIADRAIVSEGTAAPLILNNRFSGISGSAIAAFGRSTPRADRNSFQGMARSAFEASEETRGSFTGNIMTLAGVSNNYVIFVGGHARVNLLSNRVDAPERSCIGIRDQGGGESAGSILDRCQGIEIDPRTVVRFGANRLPAVAEPIAR